MYKSPWEVICFLFVLLILFIPATLWHAYVFTILWGWFGQPIFGQTFTFYQFAGLIFLWSYLRLSNRTNRDKSFVEWSIIINAFIVPSIALGFGWLLHWWIG